MSCSIDELRQKPHAVLVPFPPNGHINPMLKLGKVLHQRGFHITFVNTESNHKRFIKSRGGDPLKELPSFRFETIFDGVPDDANGDIDQFHINLYMAAATTFLAPLTELLVKLNDTVSSNVPPVSCIISDGLMKFALDAAEELGVPGFSFWPITACSVLCINQPEVLVEKGYLPLKDESYMTNGYLDTFIEDIPGMKGMRLRDLHTIVLKTTQKSIDSEFAILESGRLRKASGFIVNTFEELEPDALNALSSIFPPVYAIGLLNLLEDQANNDNKDLEEIGLNQWKEDHECLTWLDSKEPNSVIYVNYGATTIMTSDQLVEFAWGLANSDQNFLWIIRPDLIRGENAVLPPEFLESTKERGMVAGWCPQEKVLAHNSIGGFLTHSGWNSTVDSMCHGIPMICWPFFAEQTTNCWCCCTLWGIGMEMSNDVKREIVERHVRELLVGDKGKEMKRRAMEWMRLAHDAAKNSSQRNLDKIIDKVLSSLPRD